MDGERNKERDRRRERGKDRKRDCVRQLWTLRKATLDQRDSLCMVKLWTELSSSTSFNLVSTKYSYDQNNSVLYSSVFNIFSYGIQCHEVNPTWYVLSY